MVYLTHRVELMLWYDHENLNNVSQITNFNPQYLFYFYCCVSKLFPSQITYVLFHIYLNQVMSPSIDITNAQHLHQMLYQFLNFKIDNYSFKFISM